jgi:hypothetical protein
MTADECQRQRYLVSAGIREVPLTGWVSGARCRLSIAPPARRAPASYRRYRDPSPWRPTS